MIYLSTDIDKLKELLWKFDPSKYKWTWFDEPDLDYKTTAIAIHEIDIYNDELKKFIKNQKLWGT